MGKPPAYLKKNYWVELCSCCNIEESNHKGKMMNHYDIEYYEGFKKFVKKIENGMEEDLKVWKNQHRKFLFDSEGRCNPIDLLGSFTHHAYLERYTREEMTKAASLFMHMLADENLSVFIRAKLVRELGPIVEPSVIAPFFNKGGPFEIDTLALNLAFESIEGPKIRLNKNLNHVEGFTFVLDKLAGWNAFDRLVRDIAIIPGHEDLLTAVISHQQHESVMQERIFSIDRKGMENQDLLCFAIKYDKAAIGNLGFMLEQVVKLSLDDLVEDATARVIQRASNYKGDRPIDNIRAVHLYIKTKCEDCAVRERILEALGKEIMDLEKAVTVDSKHKHQDGPSF